jgi:protein transport protein SEC61 subunit alpha
MIPTAAMLGGVVIGFLTVLGELLHVAGSSVAIMLSISILYSYYEIRETKEKEIEEF